MPGCERRNPDSPTGAGQAARSAMRRAGEAAADRAGGDVTSGTPRESTASGGVNGTARGESGGAAGDGAARVVR